MSPLRPILVLALLALLAGAVHAQDGRSRGRTPPDRVRPDRDTVVEVFKDRVFHWDENQPEQADADGYNVRFRLQTATRTLRLPPRPASAADARRIIATVRVRPIHTVADGRRRPNDPWTRLGNVCVVLPGEDDGRPIEVELMRFVTSYGGPGVFEADVTALAPLLHGDATLRAFLSTYSLEPGWRLSFSLRYTSEGLGQRRPRFVRYLFNDHHVSREKSKLTARITVPAGLDVPRLRVITTGHATDGLGAHEFVSCTHVLRVDGREIVKWRPWSEKGGSVHALNPWAGTLEVQGRKMRASDFDRTGWHPGAPVEPTMIPLPELTPGPHTIEIEVLDIRGRGPRNEEGKTPHGYWAVSAAVVADEGWPEEAGGG